MHLHIFQQLRFKITPVVLMCPTMQGLVEDAIYVSQGKIPMPTEGMLVTSGYVPGT